MIFTTQKYPDLPVMAFDNQVRGSDGGGTIPWTHLQILGSQLVIFGAGDKLLGTLDLRLTNDVKIIRREEYDAYEVSPDGTSVAVLSKTKHDPVQALRDAVDAEDYDDDADVDECDCDYCSREIEF